MGQIYGTGDGNLTVCVSNIIHILLSGLIYLSGDMQHPGLETSMDLFRNLSSLRIDLSFFLGKWNCPPSFKTQDAELWTKGLPALVASCILAARSTLQLVQITLRRYSYGGSPFLLAQATEPLQDFDTAIALVGDALVQRGLKTVKFKRAVRRLEY